MTGKVSLIMKRALLCMGGKYGWCKWRRSSPEEDVRSYKGFSGILTEKA